MFRPTRRPSFLTDSSLVCFAVAAVAFVAALVGTVVNYFLAGWLQAGGMMAVGLLYLGMGLFYLGAKEPSQVKIEKEPAGDSPDWRTEIENEEFNPAAAGSKPRSLQPTAELVESARD